MKLPKVIMTDIDGVWTDGGMYYDQSDNELKKFNTSDSAGVLLAKKLKIPIAIITGENTKIVERRAKKLKIEFIFQGVSDKLKVAQKLCSKLGVVFNETAYIGDDIGDWELLNEVGFSACPANAPIYIKDGVDYVTENKGGDGAFREFVEKIISDDPNELRDILLGK